ncbi:LCP family protein [Candidatus Peregrinibacteria bacterium]|nr:LCP family protein [Candidatus Peregrinibacteria bacterium]
MGNFQIKKIRRGPSRKPLSEKAKQNIATALGILFLILLIYYGGVQIVDKLSGTRLIEIISGVVGKDLQTDKTGHTNILIAGVGGEGHEGKDLTDTLIITSINHAKKSIALLSVPRDLYVESSLGGSRVNRLYEKGKLKWGSSEGLDFLRKNIENVLDIPVHYSVRIDFEAFEKIVDSLDGVDINVEEEINDPLYPDDKTFGFSPFFLPAGLQHLDGETALKYVRSRKSSSDFDRSKRQQKLLMALKEKAFSQNIFFRKGFLKNLYYSLEDHMETNMSMREMLSFADFGIQLDTKQLSVATLNDEPIFVGGFLYTPLRELYGGAFVLLPAGDDYTSVKYFIQLVLYGPKNLDAASLAILNGTDENGLASKTKSILHRFGIKTKYVSNAYAENLTETTWYAAEPEANELINFLKQMIPGKVSDQIPDIYKQNPKMAEAKIILELGENAKQSLEKLDIFKNVVQYVK